MPRNTPREQKSSADLGGLMVRAQEGDNEAYRRLLEAVTPELRRYFRRRIAEAAMVEDLVQDTLLSIHRARHTYRPEHPFMAWAMTIARNGLTDAYRKQHRRRQHETVVEELPEGVAEAGFDGDGEQAAEAVLERLPEGQREAVRLTKIEGMTVTEASRKLGISESALKVRVHRALSLLKSVFLEDE